MHRPYFSGCYILLLFDFIEFTQEERQELWVLYKYNFQHIRLLNIVQIIMMVIAAITTTNS